MPMPIRAVIEAAPADGYPVQDVPLSLTHRRYGMRWVKAVVLEVRAGGPTLADPPRLDGRPVPSYPGWDKRRKDRLEHDHWCCVFCKAHLPERSQFTHVHHVSYQRAGYELREDLRSVCQVCHDAITLLEYAAGMTGERIDPCDPRHRSAILTQRTAILARRDRLRRNRALRIEED
jgi:hypothetical protein